MKSSGRKLRVSVQFLLVLTLWIAFFFLGWSHHQQRIKGQYFRDSYAAEQLQARWMDEAEMIRQQTSSRRSVGPSVSQAIEGIDEARQ